MSRGYFEIGIMGAKTETNVGTLWRSAYQLGAAGVFTIGRRYAKQSSDTCATPRHIPLRNFLTFDEFLTAQPFDAPLIGIEQGGEPLRGFRHPERGIYLLGAEDYGLPPAVIKRCTRIVSIESVRANSFNVAVAGALVMYGRMGQFNRLDAKS